MTIYCVLHEDWCTCKSKYLCIVEELHDVLMAISEMAAMALIEDHYDARMAYFLNTATVPLLSDGGIELLYCGNNYLGIAMESFYQLISIISTIYCTGFKRLILGLSLCIKIMAVNDKHHLIHIVQL